MNLSSFAKLAQKSLIDHSPEILTGFAVAGVVSTAVMAVKVTPQAVRLIEEQEEETHTYLTAKEKVQLTARCYIPAVGIGVATIACIIGASSINTKRNAALMSVYTLTEKSFSEYQEKVTQTLGANKEQKIRDEVAQDRVAADPPSGKQIIITGKGEVLCYDTLSGRYFESSVETIRQAQNDVNAAIINDMYASQNDFYAKIGLSPTSYGEEFGWTTDKMLDIQFSAVLSEDSRPCIAISYLYSPTRDYHKFG